MADPVMPMEAIGNLSVPMLRFQIITAKTLIIGHTIEGLKAAKGEAKLDLIFEHLQDLEKRVGKLETVTEKTKWRDVVIDMVYEFTATKLIGIAVKAGGKAFGIYAKNYVNKIKKESTTINVLEKLFPKVEEKGLIQKFQKIIDGPEEEVEYGLVEDVLGEMLDRVHKKVREDIKGKKIEPSESVVEATINEYKKIENFFTLVGLKLDDILVAYAMEINSLKDKLELVPMLFALQEDSLRKTKIELLAKEIFTEQIKEYIKGILLTGMVIEKSHISKGDGKTIRKPKPNFPEQRERFKQLAGRFEIIPEKRVKQIYKYFNKFVDYYYLYYRPLKPFPEWFHRFNPYDGEYSLVLDAVPVFSSRNPGVYRVAIVLRQRCILPPLTKTNPNIILTQYVLLHYVDPLFEKLAEAMSIDFTFSDKKDVVSFIDYGGQILKMNVSFIPPLSGPPSPQ